MIRRAVAFDSEQIAARSSGINYCQVEKEPGRPNLSVNRVAMSLQCAEDLFFKGGIRWSPSGDWNIKMAMFSVCQKCFQGIYAQRATAFSVDVFRMKGSKYNAAEPGATEQYIQTALAACTIDRAEAV